MPEESESTDDRKSDTIILPEKSPNLSSRSKASSRAEFTASGGFYEIRQSEHSTQGRFRRASGRPSNFPIFDERSAQQAHRALCI